MNNTIESVIAGKSPAYKARITRILKEFFAFCFERHLRITTGTDVSLCFSAWQEDFFSGVKNKQSHTLISDARALRVTLAKLCSRSVGGLPETNHIAPLRRLHTMVFSDTVNSRDKVLGGFDLSMSRKGESLTLTLETDVDTFLGNLISTMKKHRDVIYKVSKRYLLDASDRFNLREDMVANVDCSIFDNNPHLYHPHLVSCKGQPYSLFNSNLPNGECGKSNLLAYLWHCKSGYVDRHFSGGGSHLYKFSKNQYELREHFGLSTLSAVACCNIIIVESGINVDSLRGLLLSSQGSIHQIFEATPNGFRVGYHKARAKAHFKRHLKHVTSTPFIEQAFNYLANATSHHRSLVSGNTAKRLFLYQTNTDANKIMPISDMAFKDGFVRLLEEAKDLLEQDPSWCEGLTVECINEVLNANPNAKKLRATEGVIRWYESGGNPAVAAKYLGNSEAVSIRNYLPKELQLAVYNQRVRRFQNILVASATDGQDYQIKALNLTDQAELNEYLSRLEKRIPHWKTVMKTASANNEKSNAASKARVTLNICPENIAVMKACHVIEMQRIESGESVDDSIKELSYVYQALSDHLRTHPDRRLKRTVHKGDLLYEKKTGSYSDIKITKQEVGCGSN
ncbi:hypothetical protein LRP49_17475 [Enterovibrio sp. ZSDZ35]|uniref:Uncharacterized protein n=1 Tax=Enterovibrio qingdaonensis TaxID=2899818 RepID=A0ABT5QPP8_9GAMM|nr:hypothetical protein [Enterovibrio sp. ZSDZ35]MDD1782966.1 hypothetical protein [Enterovibrio sp. ZSDZ35]